MRIYMQKPAMYDKPARFYQLIVQADLLQGWSLVREWGRQGSAGRIKKEYFKNRDEALERFVNVRDKQLESGFRIVYMEGMEAPR